MKNRTCVLLLSGALGIAGAVMAVPASADETGVTVSADVTGDGTADAVSLSDSGGDCVVTVTPGDVGGAYSGGPRSVRIEGQVCLDRLVVGSVAGTPAHPVGITSSSMSEAAPLWLLRADGKGGLSLVAQGSFDFPGLVRIVDFNADGVADFYELRESPPLAAWFGHPDGTREQFATVDTDWFAGVPDVSETVTADGHAEVLLSINQGVFDNSLRVLTDRGVSTLVANGGDIPAMFAGRFDSATWQDVNADGWPDVQVTGAPCPVPNIGGSCDSSTFIFLQRPDRTFILGASLQVPERDIDLGDAVRVRVRINAVPHRPAPTGTVSFTVEGVPVGAAVELRGGRAVASLVPTSSGELTVVAHYSGDALNPAFDSEPAHIRVFAPSAITLLEPDVPTLASETWTGAVQVTSVPPGNVQGDSFVSFVLDGEDQGVIEVGEGPVAFSFSGLTPGRHRLVAKYRDNDASDGALLGTSSVTVRHRVLPG